MTLHFWQFSSLMANHLWQSTLSAIFAAALTMTLRRNQARFRYRLWLAASLKFLIPCSLLVSAGHRLAALRPDMNWHGAWFATVSAIGQPFTFYVTAAGRSTIDPFPFALLAALVWLGGTVAVLLAWSVRWRGVYAAKQKAIATPGGREWDALRQVEQTAGASQSLSILISTATLEPGIFGVVQPVLLWPAAISRQLSDDQLQAILAHEVTHARRRDNLAATIHMVVEAIFWFHPLVWWLGARMVEERERACDEAVLALGYSPRDYAESILKTCEFCIAAPLPCISGVTGADLKQRVVRIMSPHIAETLTATRKAMLTSLGMIALAAPILFGALSTSTMTAQTQSTQEAERQVYKIGPGVSAPKLRVFSDPEFSEEAKRAKYEGVCVLQMVVDAEGKPQQIKVVRHLKYGLDDKAIEAVSKYRFDPAMRQGQPVAVSVNIEVNFRRY